MTESGRTSQSEYQVSDLLRGEEVLRLKEPSKEHEGQEMRVLSYKGMVY